MHLAGRSAHFESSRETDGLVRSILVQLFPGWGLWAALAGLIIFNLTWLGLSARVSTDFIWLLTSWPVAILCAARLAQRQRQGATGTAMASILKLVMLVSFAGSSLAAFRVFNHLVNTLALPLVDESLFRFDTALGFNWLGYAEWVAAHPQIASVLSLFYDQIYVVILIIAGFHLAARKHGQAAELCGLLFFTAVACSALGALFPAYGAMYTLGSDELLSQLTPGAGVYAVQALTDVRFAGPVFLSSTNLPGLTTCPSYHTVLGLLCVYSCRTHWLALTAATIYAAIMIASTPVFGGHYLFDIIAGCAFTVACLVVWKYEWRLTAAIRTPKTGLIFFPETGLSGNPILT